MGRTVVRAGIASVSMALAIVVCGPASAQTPTQPPPEPPPGPAPELGLGQPGSAPPPSAPRAQPPTAAPNVVVAYPPGHVAKPKPQYEKVWYGWQTLAADGLSVAVFMVGSASRSTNVAWLGYGGFVLAPAVIHIVHGGVGKGFGSIAMRLFLPPITAGVGALVGLIGAADRQGGPVSKGDALNPTHETLRGAALGAFVGIVVGVGLCMLTDAAVLGFTKERVDGGTDDDARLRRKPAAPSLALVPIADPGGPSGASGGLGVIGRF